MELVSIIMPSYNSEKTIAQSIESILNQSYSDWELLITDDCSVDSTIDIVNQYAATEPRIKLKILEKNGGAGVARNTSISRANGKYVAFLDSDDIWLPYKLEKQIEFMKNNKYYFSYTAYQKFNAEGDGGIIYPKASVTKTDLLKSNEIGCLTVIYDQEALGKKYMPLIRRRQDLGLWISLLESCKSAYCLSEVLAKYRTDSGMTKNKFSNLEYQIKFYRQVQGLSRVETIYCFINYLFYGTLKYLK
ncbi:glycosyltransferase family 2 protein [Shewanella algae]|uniref:glycosyltransferase family 2 protein n=1 Tax=Shewanella algae TaxID=38313 RepID=UPI0031F4D27E